MCQLLCYWFGRFYFNMVILNSKFTSHKTKPLYYEIN